MKKILIPFASLLFFGCGSNTNETHNTAGNVSDSVIPEQEKSLRALIEQHPDSFALRNDLIRYFADNGNYWNAIKENDLLLQKDSNNADAWDTKARLHFLATDTAVAVKALEKAIAILPDPRYIISLATLYAQTSNPAALALADTLIKKTNNQGALQASFIKGLYYSNSGDKIKAISFFDNCISISYTFLDAYREKAISLYDLGKYLDALKTLELEVALSKTNEEAYYWMGRCFEKLGKKEEAIENYRLALQFDKDYPEAKDALGKLGVKE